jgi:hypothetical protein
LALEAGDQRTVTNIDAVFSAIIETSRREVPTAIAGAGVKLIEDLELGVRQPGRHEDKGLPFPLERKP